MMKVENIEPAVHAEDPLEEARAAAEFNARRVEAKRVYLTAAIADWRKRIEFGGQKVEGLGRRLLELDPDSSEFKKTLRERAEEKDRGPVLNERLTENERALAALPDAAELEALVKKAELDLVLARLQRGAEELTTELVRQIEPVVAKVSQWHGEYSAAWEQLHSRSIERLQREARFPHQREYWRQYMEAASVAADYFTVLFPWRLAGSDPSSPEFWKACREAFARHLERQKATDSAAEASKEAPVTLEPPRPLAHPDVMAVALAAANKFPEHPRSEK